MLFGIKHLPSGGFLPQAGVGSGKGHTYAVPSTTLPPRLFGSLAAARKALRWWLQGEVHVKHSQSDFGFDEDVMSLESKVVEGRNEEDMRLVGLRLNEGMEFRLEPEVE